MRISQHNAEEWILSCLVSKGRGLYQVILGTLTGHYLERPTKGHARIQARPKIGRLTSQKSASKTLLFKLFSQSPNDRLFRAWSWGGGNDPKSQDFQGIQDNTWVLTKIQSVVVSTWARRKVDQLRNLGGCQFKNLIIKRILVIIMILPLRPDTEVTKWFFGLSGWAFRSPSTTM